MGNSLFDQLKKGFARTFLFLAMTALPWSSSAAHAEEDFQWLSARQMVLVITPGWTDSAGVMQRFWRNEGSWREESERIPVVVGKTGLAWGKGLHPAGIDGPQKQEGDNKAPAGVFRLSGVFGYASSAEDVRLPYTAATPALRCVDDRQSLHYNRIVNSEQVRVDWKSSEKMLRHDELYRWGVIVDHNHPETEPGLGSCIFMHVWRSPDTGTAGCTAMSRDAIEQLIKWLAPDASPVLVQLPYPIYLELREKWDLPVISLQHGGTAIK